MVKKLFLNRDRERVIPTSEAPCVSRKEPGSVEASSSRNSPVSEITEHLPLLILDESSKCFPKFNSTGRSLLIRYIPPLKT